MNRKEHGTALMKKVFGEAFVESAEGSVGTFSPSFFDFLKETFSDLYGDDTLDLRTKEIIVLTTLITQKDTKPQLKVHLQAARRAGISQPEILALIKHLIVYVGFPATLNALAIAQEVFSEESIPCQK